jgi:hypothetical protein
MKKLALGALFAVLVACGGGDSDPPMLIDAPGNDGPSAACNPVAQTGCAANQKCTWIIDQVVPQEVGHVGCAPLDGNEVAVGAACKDASDTGGPPPGSADNCAKGSVCIAEICETICDPQMVGTASGCGADFACGRYIGLFEIGGTNIAGACDPLCNILDQTLIAGGAAACGSPDPAAPNRGCYPNAFFKNGSCAPVRGDDFVPTNPEDQQNVDGIKHLSRTDQVLPRFQNCKNCCAPGFIAEYVESDTSMKFVCVGLCAPTPLNTTTIGADADREFGDKAVSVKLPRNAAPAAGDGLCKITGSNGVVGKGSVTSSSENCMYAWGVFLGQDGTVDPGLGPEGEQIGFCFPHGFYTFDDDGDAGTAEVQFGNFKDKTPGGGTVGTGFVTACDYVKTGFRATTCTRAESGLSFQFQSTPVAPQKRIIRFGGINDDSRFTRH